MGTPRTTKAILKTELFCRGCGAIWKYKGSTQNTTCPYCGKAKDARDRREEAKKYPQAQWRKEGLVNWYADSENRKKRAAKHRSLLRKQVFFRITGSIHPVCARCGCNDTRLLEINHIKGGGAKELGKEGRRSTAFYYDIVSGKRATDDLELLCKPCNSIHALEMKYGPLPMKMVWLGSETT